MADKDFDIKLAEIAKKLGTSTKILRGVMQFESGGDHTKVNPTSNATGLIQFMPRTARKLGTTTDKLKRMDPVSQLDYVEKYYARHKGKLNSIEDAYLATFWPTAMGKSDDYRLPSYVTKQNKAFDTDRDGRISVGEIKSKLYERLPQFRPQKPMVQIEQPAVADNTYSINKWGSPISSIQQNTLNSLSSSRNQPIPDTRTVRPASEGIDEGYLMQLGSNPSLATDRDFVSKMFNMNVPHLGDGGVNNGPGDEIGNEPVKPARIPLQQATLDRLSRAPNGGNEAYLPAPTEERSGFYDDFNNRNLVAFQKKVFDNGGVVPVNTRAFSNTPVNTTIGTMPSAVNQPTTAACARYRTNGINVPKLWDGGKNVKQLPDIQRLKNL